jgi:RHS repeat-associated protein
LRLLRQLGMKLRYWGALLLLVAPAAYAADTPADIYKKIAPAVQHLLIREDERVVWNLTPPVSGVYEVFARWIVKSGNTTAAPYTIHHNGGATVVTANQTTNNAQWVSLGKFTLAPNANHRVELRRAASGAVIADAIRIVSPTTITGTVVHNVFTDHLDTPRLVTTAGDNPQPVWRWDNDDPFGANPAVEVAGPDTFPFNVRFRGQYFDKETNLHYNYFRDCYDSPIGRYCQPDPIGLAGGTNLYSYVGANPLIRIDPTGQFFFLPFIAAAFGGGGASTGTLLAGSALLFGTAIAIQSSSSSTGAKSTSDPFFLSVLESGTASSQNVCRPALPDVQPGNLCEQLALAEAKAGAGNPIVWALGDAPRLEALYGPGPWIKMQHTHVCPDGRRLVIHYFTNGRGLNVELKFV